MQMDDLNILLRYHNLRDAYKAANASHIKVECYNGEDERFDNGGLVFGNDSHHFQTLRAQYRKGSFLTILLVDLTTEP